MSDTVPLVVATDGSCLSNPGPGGWAWYIDQERWCAGGAVSTTNNAMELRALLEVLVATPASRPLVVFCDSRYVLDAVTKWAPSWARRGWVTSKGAPVANRELIEEICGLRRGREVSLRWVKAHNGDQRNEAADRKAVAAARRARRGVVAVEGPGLRFG